MILLTRDFLFEVGVEELPARFLTPTLQQLKDMAWRMLNDHRLVFKEISTYGTPRRLVLYVEEIAALQKPAVREVKGPAAKIAFDEQKKPTRAALGFAKSQGVKAEDLIVKPVGHIEYVFAMVKEEGKPAQEILKSLCLDLLTEMHFPKFMRWGEGEMRFARPIRWLLALYGDQVIPFTIGGITSSRKTFGHRFLSSLEVVVDNPADYFRKMQANFVVVDPNQRKATICEQLLDEAAEVGGIPLEDKELLDEVANLVEFPTVLRGHFKEDYLKLPKEVLITSMREHQRYFPVLTSNGNLLPYFLAVSNMTKSKIIQRGFERVLHARLTDATFFWVEDLKTDLCRRVNNLKKIIWQENLGTLYDKRKRLISLSLYLATMLGADETQKAHVKRAAGLAKADLTTNMVYEFPELQGVMGREYALRQGEELEVAEAIFEHYLPRFAGDSLPVTIPGIIISIADKIDTLVGCFALGKQPTGSQDPYALRRLAMGICGIITESRLVLSLRKIILFAYENYQNNAKLEFTKEKVVKDLEGFFIQRLRGFFSEQGIPYDISEAVFAVGVDDLYGAWERAVALADFRRSEPAAFDGLFTFFTRANNLSKKHHSLVVDSGLFLHPVEEELYLEIQNTRSKTQKCLKQRNYRGALAGMVKLKDAVDNFFDGVMVMVEDEVLRKNRLGLLKNVVDITHTVADLSRLS